MTVAHEEIVLVSTEMTKPPKDKRNIKSAFSAEDATEQKVLSAMCFDAASLVKMHSPVEEKYPTSASSSPCLSKCSRYGRDSQRWDGETRLVTGAVPITKKWKNSHVFSRKQERMDSTKGRLGV